MGSNPPPSNQSTAAAPPDCLHTVAQPDRRKRVETPSTQQTSTPRGGDRENLNVSEAVRVGVR
jgi:hypothetical protein